MKTKIDKFDGIEFIEDQSGKIIAIAANKTTAIAYANSSYWVYPVVTAEEDDGLRAVNWSVDGKVHYV
jgi:hypothetical protein